MPVEITAQYAVFGGSPLRVAVIDPAASAVTLYVVPLDVVLIVMYPAATVLT
jgi:hypothetical protein